MKLGNRIAVDQSVMFKDMLCKKLSSKGKGRNRLDLIGVESIDVSALQLLLAYQNSIVGTGGQPEFLNVPDQIRAVGVDL